MIHAVHVDRRTLLAILLGGCAGAAARALIEQGLGHATGSWPWATFAVNVSGAFLLGWVVVALPHRRPLLGIGFCGALTTFSTMALELLTMLDRGRIGLALGYAAASIAAGYAGVVLAQRLGPGIEAAR